MDQSSVKQVQLQIKYNMVFAQIGPSISVETDENIKMLNKLTMKASSKKSFLVGNANEPDKMHENCINNI